MTRKRDRTIEHDINICGKHSCTNMPTQASCSLTMLTWQCFINLRFKSHVGPSSCLNARTVRYDHTHDCCQELKRPSIYGDADSRITGFTKSVQGYTRSWADIILLGSIVRHTYSNAIL